jgi:hypothetical protein
MFRPPREKSSDSILVNGQGPAMQETRAFPKTFPCPASRDAEPIAAFHLSSGEQGLCWWHGTFPVFTTWNVVTPAPTFTSAVVSMEYLTKTFATTTFGWSDSGSHVRMQGHHMNDIQLIAHDFGEIQGQKIGVTELECDRLTALNPANKAQPKIARKVRLYGRGETIGSAYFYICDRWLSSGVWILLENRPLEEYRPADVVGSDGCESDEESHSESRSNPNDPGFGSAAPADWAHEQEF